MNPILFTKRALGFVVYIFEFRNQLASLIKNDFKKQYLGSYFGLFWAFFQPLSFVVVIWFAFEIGLRAGEQSDGTPFFLFLISGLIPWFFIANTLNSTTESITGNGFLVKKISFKVSILPLVQIGSSLLVHLTLVGLLLLVFLLYGYAPSIYWLQLPVLILLSLFMLLGVGWLVSSVCVFVKDIKPLVAVMTQIGFWATPILWNIDRVPEKYQLFVQLNPAVFIIENFRNSLYKEVWIWQQPKLLMFYMLVTVFFLIFGAFVFSRLRPHFGDVI